MSVEYNYYVAGCGGKEVVPLTPAEKEFILEHESDDPASLILQGHRFSQLPLNKLVAYIRARQKIKQKLPLWYQNLNIIYPSGISLEQSSSASTGALKASLVSGEKLIDLTGGFGIDSYFFARNVKEVIYVEQNPELTSIAAHNAKVLGTDNISCHTADAATFLNNYRGTADWIYLDPARRDNQNRKIHLLQDCEPDVLSLLPILLKKGGNILLKTSPMLDINQAVQELKQIYKVYIVAVDNECKEVLYHLTASAGLTPYLETYNLLSGNETQYFNFAFTDEEGAAIQYSLPKTYIYEPNPAVLKAGAFKSIARHFHLHKLHRNSHLYTSEALLKDFPGRIFLLKATSPYRKKELLRQLPENKANITVRNFPESVAQIRTRTGIKEGGETYLFATTDLNQKPVILICEKA